jgi:hypothetical protein
MTLYLTTYFVWLYSIAGYLLIIATRFHYTVDVFLGCLLTVLTWYAYHSYVKRLLEKRRFIIARVFVWFEGLEGDAMTPISLLNGPKPNQPTELPPVVVASAGDATTPINVRNEPRTKRRTHLPPIASVNADEARF